MNNHKVSSLIEMLLAGVEVRTSRGMVRLFKEGDELIQGDGDTYEVTSPQLFVKLKSYTAGQEDTASYRWVGFAIPFGAVLNFLDKEVTDTDFNKACMDYAIKETFNRK